MKQCILGMFENILRLVETLGSLWMWGDVLKQLEEDWKSGVRHVPHRVLERPDDWVQHQFELLGGDGEEGGEAVGVDRLQEGEEVGPEKKEGLHIYFMKLSRQDICIRPM